jgi:hypothetical protein
VFRKKEKGRTTLLTTLVGKKFLLPVKIQGNSQQIALPPTSVKGERIGLKKEATFVIRK